MGLFKNIKINDKHLDKMKKDVYLASTLDVPVRVEHLTIGARIRDGLVKPISTDIMPNNAYDGDVEGIDKDLSEE